ncbi:LamG-like jellyroll fold domain-containing protein [Saccharothrix saharensis]|uniref:LamG-like jellyroll fold domain-containing protein n=1 Tax=Saccharothrix saharensis TaxID=571190 RepID=UPI0036A7BDDB
MILASLVSSNGTPAPPMVAAPVAEAPEETSAMLAALRQGSRVEAASLRTESATTFANPDGTWTLEQSTGPVRVRRSAGWVRVDRTLDRAPDGSLTTRATTAGVTFSGGGTSPLVRISAGGKSMSLVWPRPLPEPRVEGETATYPDVLPGVDLRVAATDRGFGHDLVIRTREAAANPELARIAFGLRTEGVRLTADPAGNLSAADETGAVVFTVAAPLMWDGPEDDTDRRERPVGVEVTADAVTLVPDGAMLADPAVRLPIVIDPQYSYHTPHAGSSWTLVRRSHPGNSHWNLVPRDEDERVKGVARIGHAPGWPAEYLDRSLFQFDTSPVRGATVVSATFQAFQIWKYANTCDANAVDPLVLHRTDAIGPGTTWNAQPVWREELGRLRSVGKLGHCDPAWVGVDARAAVQLAAGNQWTAVTLGLKANDEGGDAGWKRFYVQNGTYPKLTITYNRAPGAPAGIGTEPALVACRWCAGVPYAGATTLNLKANVSDPDGGQVTAWWAIRKPTTENRQQTLASGSKFTTPLDTRPVADGTTVTWEMQATDGALSSPVVPGPKFVVDKQAPKQAPNVTGVLYPEDNRWHGGVGTSDTFTFAPNLAAGETNDVDHYLWGWQDPPSTKVEAVGGLGGSAAVTTAPTGDGPRTLYVRAVDRANNPGPTKAYRFYVRAGNGAMAQWSFEGNAQDSAFLGDRHGTLNGAATYAPGALGNAVVFERGGTMTAPNAVRTDASFTVSAWVRLDSVVRDHVAVSQSGGRTSAFSLGYRADAGGKWFFWMPGTDVGAPAVTAAWSRQPAGTGVWTHLAGVYDASKGQIRLYVDGEESATVAHRSTWSGTGEVHVGNALVNEVYQNHWLGAVDEVQVHDRVVLQPELKAAVTRGNVQVGHWKFDEATESSGDAGTTARNAVHGGAMAVLTDGARFVRDGIVGGGVRLDGVDDRVTTNAPAVRTDQSFTVAAWVTLDDVDRTYAVLSQDGRNVCGFCFQYSKPVDRWVLVLPGTDEVTPTTFYTVQSTAAPKPGVPTHLVGTYDAATDTLSMYVDGVRTDQLAGVPAWSATGPFQVGRDLRGGTVQGHHLKGTVDEVRVYSRAISGEEVQGIVSQSDVTVGSWKLDGDPNDSSGMGRHGVLNGTVDWAAGQTSVPDASDLAVRLNGTDAHVSAPHAVDTDRSFSVGAWVRVDQTGRQATVVSEDGDRVSGFVLRATVAGRWSFGMYRSDVNGGGGFDEVVGSAVQIGAWTHLAAVHSKDRGQLELYVNGVVVGTAPRTAAGFNAVGGVQIGRAKLDGNPVDHFAGAVDDVSAYSRTLLVDEIRTMAGRDLSLVHNWQLDETSGVNTADAVGSRGGTLSGGASFGTGRVGNSLHLTGDGAMSTTGVDLRTDQSFTVAAWVHLDSADSAATAVSVDGTRASKFRLGHVPADDQNQFGRWVFEMPEQDTDAAPVTRAALSTWPGEVGTWVHLVGVYDSSARMVWLYLNGVRQNDGTLNTAWPGRGGLQVGRGLVAGAPAHHWSGSVDEVRLYTSALDKTRIESLYRSFPALTAPPALPEADAGHWKFDEGTATAVTDHSGQGRTATMRGGAEWIAGRSGTAAWFNGTGSYAETAVPALDTGRSFSVSAWAYLSDDAVDRTVFGQDGGQVSTFQVQYRASARRWAVVVPVADEAAPVTAVLTSTEAAGAGDWTHLAVVHDADADELRLYVNGLLSATRLSTPVLAVGGPFTVGRGKWKGVNAGFFSRGVDDVRAFTRALSDGEVRRVHDDVPTIELGSWRFDNRTTDDYAPRANHAVVSSQGTSFGTGISGTALQFDGVTGAATTVKAGTAMRDSFTVSTWVRLTRGDRVATVLGQDGSRMSGFSLQYRPESGRWAFGARTADSDGAPMVHAQAAEPARLNEWVHLAGVYDNAARQMRLYVDGRLSATKSSGALWLATGGMTLGRGKVNGQAAEFLAGAVDEVRVDQGVVSDEVIASRAGWPAPPPGVLGSFVNAAGDHYTAETNLPVRAGYRFESSLGMVAAATEGTVVLYACQSGADAFTSTDPACGGAVVVGEAGRVHAEAPEGVPTTPVYRCVLGGDRFESLRSDCAGATLLGHTAAYSPLARYASRIGRDHWTTTGGTTPSYRYEGTLGWVPLLPQEGTVPLMSCRDGVDEFTSADPACEGKQVVDRLGRVWPEPPVGVDTKPLYRCAINGERYDSTDAKCEGYAVDRLLGHVLAASPVQRGAAGR